MVSITLVPNGYDSSKSSFSSISTSNPITNAYANTSSTTYADINLNSGMSSSSKLAITFNVSQIPSGSTINSIGCKFKANLSGNSYASLTGTARLHTSSTSMGSSVSLTKNSVNTYTFSNTGSWTYDQLQELYLLFTCTAGFSWGGSSNKLQLYGAELTIDYTSGSSGPTEQLMIKQSGSWINVSNVYKKVNGTWVKQDNLSSLFDASANYIKG